MGCGIRSEGRGGCKTCSGLLLRSLLFSFLLAGPLVLEAPVHRGQAADEGGGELKGGGVGLHYEGAGRSGDGVGQRGPELRIRGGVADGGELFADPTALPVELVPPIGRAVLVKEETEKREVLRGPLGGCLWDRALAALRMAPRSNPNPTHSVIEKK